MEEEGRNRGRGQKGKREGKGAEKGERCEKLGEILVIVIPVFLSEKCP